jgi:hypothetical protein
MSLGHRASQVFLTSIVLGLSACGGDGSAVQSSTATPAASPSPATASTPLNARLTPFLGRWASCAKNIFPNNSELDELTVSAIGGDKVAITRITREFTASADCAGTSRIVEEEQSVMTLLGQTITVGGVMLEKFSRDGQVSTYVHLPGGGPPLQSVPLQADPLVSAGVVPGPVDRILVGDEASAASPGNPTVLMPDEYIKQP